MARHVRDTGTDVLLLQEVQRAQARRIARAVDARSRHWGLKHWPVRVWSEGMAMLGVTVPVMARSFAVTRRWQVWSWRRRLIQLARLGDTRLVNLHLTPHGPTSEEDRAREVTWLLDHVDLSGPPASVIAAGDYNARPPDALFERLRAARLRDSWPAAHPDDPDGGLSNWSGRRNRPPMKRIDYLWVSAIVEVLDVSVPAYGSVDFERFSRLSDHLPVTATLRIGSTGGG